MLFERIERDVAPMREHYRALINDPEKIEDLLQAGARKARAVATPFLRELRQAVGLRKLGSPPASASKNKAAKSAAPAFKQYREKDGKFYFKLLGANARVLLQSQGFDSPKDAALTISMLQKEGPSALTALGRNVDAAHGVSADDLAAALQFFAASGN